MIIDYYCKKCDKVHVRSFYIEDKIYKEEVLVKSLTQEEIDALPEWDDPRLYEEYKTVEHGDLPPEKLKCLECNRVMVRHMEDLPLLKEGINSMSSLKERRRYAINGMDKQQATKFYNESIEASKERMKSGGQHYKKVVPNFEVLVKEGKAKKLSSDKAANSKEYLKKLNIQLTKDGTIGKASGRKR